MRLLKGRLGFGVLGLLGDKIPRARYLLGFMLPPRISLRARMITGCNGGLNKVLTR
jgi:hypothetical protein